jgi:phosphoglycerol transferase MdoB-like AlkP superfamily enzyme
MHKLLERIAEIIAWIQIVASPLLVGIILAAFLYLSDPSIDRFFIGIVIVFFALIIVIVWANDFMKTKGIVWVMSRNMATLELVKFRYRF